MTLSPLIVAAAQELGTALGCLPGIQAYQTAKIAANSNQEVIELEQRLEQLYLDLSGRENAGESLPRMELNTYYSLKYQVASNPLIIERESKMEFIKATLARVSNDLSSELGVDYTDLVLT